MTNYFLGLLIYKFFEIAKSKKNVNIDTKFLVELFYTIFDAEI